MFVLLFCSIACYPQLLDSILMNTALSERYHYVVAHGLHDKHRARLGEGRAEGGYLTKLSVGGVQHEINK